MENQKKYNVLDLFCGAGGMAEGFLQAGFKIPFASDFSEEASKTYINRHKQLGLNTRFYRGDISRLAKGNFLKRELNDTKIHVVIGGPPCQGFSLTGKRSPNDLRNELFMKYLKVIKIVKPEYFVMENVLGILSFKIPKIKGLSGCEYIDEYVTDILVKEAFEIGYKLSWKTLNAKDYGVPQSRLRVIFIGHKILKRNNKVYNLNVIPCFPERSPNTVSVFEAISDLNFLESGQKSEEYLLNNDLSEYQKKLRQGQTPDFKNNTIKSLNLHNHIASKHNINTIRRFTLLNNGERLNDLLKRLKNDLTVEEFEEINTKKRSCYKLDEQNVSPTILTLPDDIIHYDAKHPRILTVRELARLQSFDDSFCFLGKRTTGGSRRKLETPQYTQVGNAVPPFFAKAIALEILKALDLSILKKESASCRRKKLLDLEPILN